MTQITKILSIAFMGAMLIAAPLRAQDVWITPDLPFVELEVGDAFYLIERDQDNEARIVDSFAKTSRPCPPFCVQPMSVADGVATVGEVELLDFLQDHVQPGTGLLVDARVESFYKAGTIPGSINLPFNMFANSATNPFLDPILVLLGGTLETSGQWNFAGAKNLLLFCNGPWCGQSPAAIRNLIKAGYPAENLHYYRGGDAGLGFDGAQHNCSRIDLNGGSRND